MKNTLKTHGASVLEVYAFSVRFSVRTPVRLFAIAIVVAVCWGLVSCSNPTTSTEKTLTGITVTTFPAKTEYNIGENLDTTGMVVTAAYSDGSTAAVTGYTTSGYDKTRTGNQTITVTYSGKTAEFTVNVIDPNRETVAIPAATPAAGTYTSAQSVTLACSTEGASIYYTTDGSTPTVSSTLYSGPVIISSTSTLKVIAIKEGMNNSGILTAVYTINITIDTVAEPTVNPAAGTYTSAQSVTLACSTSGASIYYTTDGSAPTVSSTLYSSPVNISATTTLKAIAVKDGMTNSGILTAMYTINLPSVVTPTATPAAGDYYAVQSVTLTTATEDAIIYYTLDGTTPTVSSSVAHSSLLIAHSTTLKAIAVKEGMINSGILTAQYNILLGTTSIGITFAQISDPASTIAIDIPVLHRFNGESSAVLTLTNPGQYDTNSITWRVNGVEIGTGSSVTLNAANPAYNTFGTHYLTLNVKKAGVSYNKTIPFTVEY